MPVKLFPAADYAGVMQDMAAGQLELASFGASGFAGAWLACQVHRAGRVPLREGRFHLLLFGQCWCAPIPASSRSRI